MMLKDRVGKVNIIMRSGKVAKICIFADYSSSSELAAALTYKHTFNGRIQLSPSCYHHHHLSSLYFVITFTIITILNILTIKLNLLLMGDQVVLPMMYLTSLSTRLVGRPLSPHFPCWSLG